MADLLWVSRELEDQGSGKPLRLRLCDVLRAAIIAEKIPAGSVLSEVGLAAALGVSRTPIREALQRLEVEAWVRAGSRGFTVTQVSDDDLRDLYLVWSVLEGLGVRLATTHAGEEDLESLHCLVDEMEVHTKNQHLLALDSRCKEFHGSIIRLSLSRTLDRVIGHLFEQIRRGRKNVLEIPGRAEKALAEHKAVFEAMCRRDSEEAGRLMERHIRNVCEAVLGHRAPEVVPESSQDGETRAQ